MEEMDAFNRKYNCIGIRGPAKYDVLSLMRMLAKIGHSYVVANIGIDNFEHFSVPLIMGTDLKASYLVGGDLELPSPVEEIQSNRVGWMAFRSSRLVVAQIRLLQFLGTPQYYVVVGRLKYDVDEFLARK